MHQAYIERATEEWIVADGGRCYKEAQMREYFIQQVKCPDCLKDKWFVSDWAYRQHWHTVHSG